MRCIPCTSTPLIFLFIAGLKSRNIKGEINQSPDIKPFKGYPKRSLNMNVIKGKRGAEGE
jgi:hypothetical protein